MVVYTKGMPLAGSGFKQEKQDVCRTTEEP